MTSFLPYSTLLGPGKVLVISIVVVGMCMIVTGYSSRRLRHSSSQGFCGLICAALVTVRMGFFVKLRVGRNIVCVTVGSFVSRTWLRLDALAAQEVNWVYVLPSLVGKA